MFQFTITLSKTQLHRIITGTFFIVFKYLQIGDSIVISDYRPVNNNYVENIVVAITPNRHTNQPL